jgi:hypothetical protein
MPDRRLAVLFCLLALVAAAPAAAKPNFTGEWKMNISKSDFGKMPGPDSASSSIGHQDPQLKLHIKQSGERGEFEMDLNYTTDGKECINEIGGNPLKSVLKWDGEVLIIDTKASFDGNEFSMQDKWQVSEGGKVLTIDRHMSSSMGESDQKLVFEKQ